MSKHLRPVFGLDPVKIEQIGLNFMVVYVKVRENQQKTI